MRNLIGLILLTTAGCASGPPDASYLGPDVQNVETPALVPLGPILNRTAALPDASEGLGADGQSRLARLKARAAQLRGPVLTPAERARLRR